MSNHFNLSCTPEILATSWQQPWNCTYTTCEELARTCGPTSENATIVGKDAEKGSGEILGDVFCFYSESNERANECADKFVGNETGLPSAAGSIFTSSKSNSEGNVQEEEKDSTDGSKRETVNWLILSFVGLVLGVQIVNLV